MSDDQSKNTTNQTDTNTNKKLLGEDVSTNEFDKIEEEFKKELDASFQAKYEDVKKQLMENVKEVINNTKKESDEKYAQLLEENKQRQEQLISELKTKFSEIQKEISSRQSHVGDGQNPYRQMKNEDKKETLKNFFSDPNVSSQEKYEMFRKNFLNK